MRIQIVQIPSQASESVLPGLEQDVEFSRALFLDPVHIPLHIPLRVSRAQDGHLRLQELRKSLFPFMSTSRVPETRVEEHKAVKVWVIWIEILSFMHIVEVINVGSDLHLWAETVLNNGAKWIFRCAFRKRKFVVSVGHTFRSDEDEVDKGSGEHMGELKPDLTGQGRLGTSSKNKYADWRSLETQPVYVRSFSHLGRMQCVSKC